MKKRTDMEIRFLLSSENELEEAVDYYNSQSEGLGFEFAAEIKSTLQRIIQYPKAWTEISKRTRRCRTNKFPYGVIYQTREEVILIVAIMHLHRKPRTWKLQVK
ncbi:MAG: type II toxin-antitoxin system RelE/ParE family toxin [Elusimicrobiota bacterium]